MGRVINRAYMGIVRGRPEIWEYLYDNPDVLRKLKGVRNAIHKHNSPKLRRLIDDFKPDAIVCTQAFPCGLVADYKKREGLPTPLVGVLTDYAPHSYWIFDNVDAFVVPSEDTGKRLIENGVLPEKIRVYGIPVDPKFNDPINKSEIFERMNLDGDIPVILIMGGTQGIGPIKEAIVALDAMQIDAQIIAITGINKKLYKWLIKRSRRFRKRVDVYPFVDNMEEVMAIATLLITKPGGITTAEALCMGVPIMILHPLPGQESMNTQYLIGQEVAVRAKDQNDAAVLTEALLTNRGKLRQMSDKEKSLARPYSALDTAKLVLELAQ